MTTCKDQQQDNVGANVTNHTPRTAHVSLKTLSEAMGPKAVRFDGKTFNDLKERLSSAGFPGYSKDSFVQVLDESQHFVCILDHEVLPPGDLYVEVHNYNRGMPKMLFCSFLVSLMSQEFSSTTSDLGGSAGLAGQATKFDQTMMSFRVNRAVEF